MQGPFPPVVRLRIHTRERRYRFEQAEALEARLTPHVAAVAYDPGRIESDILTVYLDTTPGTWSVGRARTKIRCKSYDGGANWWFELKRRTGNVVDKWRRAAGIDELVRLMTGEDRWEAIRPFAGDRPMRALFAVRYRRTAYEGGDLRVTVDRDVQIHAVQPGQPWTVLDAVDRVPGVVVEAKRDGDLPPWLAPSLTGHEAKGFSKSRFALARVKTEGNS